MSFSRDYLKLSLRTLFENYLGNFLQDSFQNLYLDFQGNFWISSLETTSRNSIEGFADDLVFHRYSKILPKFYQVSSRLFFRNLYVLVRSIPENIAGISPGVPSYITSYIQGFFQKFI